MKIRKKKKLMKKENHKNWFIKSHLLKYKKTEKWLCWKDFDKNLLKESIKIQKWDSGGCYIKWAG